MHAFLKTNLRSRVGPTLQKLKLAYATKQVIKINVRVNINLVDLSPFACCGQE